MEEKYLKKLEEIMKEEMHVSPKGRSIWCEDEERLHRICDEILIELIKELGYKKIVEKYEEAKFYFWYA